MVGRVLSWDLRRLTAPLRRNVPAKLFAATFAFVLWLFVNAGKRETQVVQFPVELRNTPERTMVTTKDRVDSVAVKLNGPGALLASLDGRRAPIVLDLGGVETGREVRFKIREEMIHVPRGVRILDIDPDRVPIRLEGVRKGSVPVRVAHAGEPADGYKLAGIKAEPPSVRVTGPASMVDALTSIETEPVDLSGLTQSTQRPVTVGRGDQLLALTPERVTAQIAIEPVLATREFKRVQVQVRDVDGPFQLRPPHVKLTVRGPERLVDALELGAGSVYVDGAGLRTGEHTLEPRLDLPPGVEVVRREPPLVTLEILERRNGARK